MFVDYQTFNWFVGTLFHGYLVCWDVITSLVGFYFMVSWFVGTL